MRKKEAKKILPRELGVKKEGDQDLEKKAKCQSVVAFDFLLVLISCR